MDNKEMIIQQDPFREELELAAKAAKKRKRKESVQRVCYYVIIGIFAAFILVPLYIVFITAFKTGPESSSTVFTWWPKQGLTLDGFKALFIPGFDLTFPSDMPEYNLIRAFFVTLWMYIPTTLVGILVSALAAYGFAKMEFILKKPIFNILISAMTLPNAIGMIAAVVLYDAIGWLGTPLPLMIPKMMGSIGSVFFLRQFYMGLPDDLIGAGKVDGLDDMGIFWRIALPLSLPALGSQFVLTFIAAFNDYMGPLYYMFGMAEFYPLTLSLSFFNKGLAQWNVLMAGAVVATVPMLILYILSQRFILKGVSITSGLKG